MEQQTEEWIIRYRHNPEYYLAGMQSEDPQATWKKGAEHAMVFASAEEAKAAADELYRSAGEIIRKESAE